MMTSDSESVTRFVRALESGAVLIAHPDTLERLRRTIDYELTSARNRRDLLERLFDTSQAIREWFEDDVRQREVWKRVVDGASAHPWVEPGKLFAARQPSESVPEREDSEYLTFLRHEPAREARKLFNLTLASVAGA